MVAAKVSTGRGLSCVDPPRLRARLVRRHVAFHALAFGGRSRSPQRLKLFFCDVTPSILDFPRSLAVFEVSFLSRSLLQVLVHPTSF